MKLSNISKKYRSNTVLDNINFTLDSNITSLIGENGADNSFQQCACFIYCRPAVNHAFVLVLRRNLDAGRFI